MPLERDIARESRGAELRRSPVAVERRESAPDSPGQRLQRRLGNQGAAALVARSAAERGEGVQRAGTLEISSPNDPAEREATAQAARVVSMGSAGPVGAGVDRAAVQRDAAGKAAATPALSAEIEASLHGGVGLPSDVRAFMEPRFAADFGRVRIHTDEHAAWLSEGVSAHAFTVRNHIFFARGQYRPDTDAGRELIAHELTHTIQQGASPLHRRAAPAIQREGSWWETITDFGESHAWKLVDQAAPGLAPILKKGSEGAFEWLKDQATSAVEGVFNKVMAPVRAVAGVGQQLSAQFTPMLAQLQAAAGQIARNDCTPLREAADSIAATAEKIVTPIVEKVQPVVVKVKAFLDAVWDKLGAPIWGWIKEYAAFQWEQIQWMASQVQALFSWIWDKTAWIRSLAQRAWTWVKNKLGIGEGPEGKDGLLQWVQGKLEAAWNAIKAKIEPFKKELTAVALTVAAVAVAVSPVGPIVAVGAAVAGAVQGLRWIHAHWGKGNAIVEARVYLEKTLIPSLLGAIQKLGASVTKMAGSISTTLGNVAGGLTRAVGSLAGSVLAFAVSAVQWLADQAVALAGWAQRELGQLAAWLESAVARLQVFLDRILKVLGRVANVILDIWMLPLMLGETIWNLIPACIRDPIVDFLGPIILRQIEIFQELAKDKEAWQKTKDDVGKIIKLVFKDRDLMGAVKATFLLILRVFNIPPELLVTVAQKAMAAWDVVSKKPIEFLKNTVRALGHGFKLLWTNFGSHLKYGLQGWLFGELAEKKITPPASWTDVKAVFWFVMDVLGLSVDHMFELLAKKFDEKKVAKVKLWYGRIASAVAWINKSIDTSKSPAENAAGLVNQAKDFGASVLTGIAEWVIAQVAKELAIMAVAAAASAGLSEVVDIVRRLYKAILTAVRWARRILDMANETLDNVLDIASGAVEKVGVKFEQIMHRGMPVVIGFLADQVGLGGVGPAIRDVVDKLRAKVDEGILWLIDKIKAGIEAAISLVKAGAEKLLSWWNQEEPFTNQSGKKHTLKFRGGETAAELAIESKPMLLGEYLAKLDRNIYKTQIEAIEDRIKKIGALKGDGNFGKGKGEEIQEHFLEIVKQLKAIKDGAEPPPSLVTWTTSHAIAVAWPPGSADVLSVSMKADPLSINPGTNAGSAPLEEGKLMQSVKRRSSAFINGHLLNHNVHGPGRTFNLVPITRSMNGIMASGPEEAVKKAVLEKNQVVRYTVAVAYDKHKGRAELPDEAELPTSLTIAAVALEQDDGGKWVKEGQSVYPSKTLKMDLDPDAPIGAVPVTVDLSRCGAAALMKIPLVTATGVNVGDYFTQNPQVADRVAKKQDANGNPVTGDDGKNQYSSYDQLPVPPDIHQALQSWKYAKLH
jgi:hypothetical protein